MTAYRLRPVVHDLDGETLWLGVLPDGPTISVQGSGTAVVSVLQEAHGQALTAADVTAVLRKDIPDLPGNVEGEISAFLAELAQMQVVAPA